MENKTGYLVRVEVELLLEVPVTAYDEDEAGDIAASLVWDQIPGDLLNECVNYGSKAIEVYKGVSA